MIETGNYWMMINSTFDLRKVVNNFLPFSNYRLSWGKKKILNQNNFILLPHLFSHPISSFFSSKLTDLNFCVSWLILQNIVCFSCLIRLNEISRDIPKLSISAWVRLQNTGLGIMKVLRMPSENPSKRNVQMKPYLIFLFCIITKSTATLQFVCILQRT